MLRFRIVGVLVRFGKHRAILREAVWRCADPLVEARLNQETDTWFEEGGPPVSAADPESCIASEMARRMGGRVLMRVRAKSMEPYTERRQMNLAFPARMLKLR